MPIVKDVESGEVIVVKDLDPKRALLAVFLREVLYKSAPEKVTPEVVEKHLPQYQNAIQRQQERNEDGSVSIFTQLWRFRIEEGTSPASPRPSKARRRSLAPRPQGSHLGRRPQ